MSNQDSLVVAGDADAIIRSQSGNVGGAHRRKVALRNKKTKTNKENK